MYKQILILSIAVALLAMLYPHLTISRFLGFGAYIHAGGGTSLYDTILMCHAYMESPAPVPFTTKVDCIGGATGFLLKGVASFLAGSKLEEFVLGVWEIWLTRRQG